MLLLLSNKRQGPRFTGADLTVPSVRLNTVLCSMARMGVAPLFGTTRSVTRPTDDWLPVLQVNHDTPRLHPVGPASNPSDFDETKRDLPPPQTKRIVSAVCVC